MEYNSVPRTKDDILGMKQDGFSICESTSLGNSMACNSLTLIWSLFLTCAKDGPPNPIWEGGNVIPWHLRLVA